jgi:hypothetical protein
MAFHVPEHARIREHPIFGSSARDGNNGAFLVESPEHGWWLQIIASDGSDPAVPEAHGWEHVSVHASRPRGKDMQPRTPNWREMTFVKDLFWEDEDVVMQLHPRRSAYVNIHPHTLHLWRHANIPTPPLVLV